MENDKTEKTEKRQRRDPHAMGAWCTDPETMRITGRIIARRDIVTGGGHKVASIIVLVRHGRDVVREARFPIDFWDWRIPVAREGAEVECEFRVAPRMMPDGRVYAALRGVVCREVAAAQAKDEARTTKDEGKAVSDEQ